MVDKQTATPDVEQDVLWYDAQSLVVEGQGWIETEKPYDRLPSKAKPAVREEVWNLSRHSAGLCVRFITDAPAIHARWSLTSPQLAMPHMPATGVSGLDLYVNMPDEGWRWLANGRPLQVEVNTAQLIQNLPEGRREYMLYLPLYNGVEQLEIGIPEGHTLTQPPARPANRRKPLVVYGTSIAQGACASRPGMAYTAIVGRALDRPVINLGFSGNGRLEPEIATLMAELDAAVYVIDCLPNVMAPRVTANTASLVKTLRDARPETPILLVEDRVLMHPFPDPAVRERYISSRAALREQYAQLQEAGVKHLYYLEGDALLADDSEATVDDRHPTDFGMVQYAKAYLAALEPILHADQ